MKKVEFNKKIAICDTLGKVKYWKKMTCNDVMKYYKNIGPRGFLPETANIQIHCKRCGIFIGPELINKVEHVWEGFTLCDGCYENKTTGGKQSTPDLEDLMKCL